MSKISTVIDGMTAFLLALYPNSIEHVNPYALERNDDFGLADGYSFFLAPGANTNEHASCLLSIDRDIVVNRSLKVYASKEDVALRKNVEKQLMEDQYNMLLAIENDATLNGLLALITFIGDNGIELILGDNEEVLYLALRSTYTVKYYENLQGGV